MKYKALLIYGIFKSVFISFTIWVLTALINAVLSGVLLLVFSKGVNEFSGAFFMCSIATLIFSIPGIFILWIVMLIKWTDIFLFRVALKWGFIISLSSAIILFYILPFDMFKEERFYLSIGVMIALISSIMFHHSIIKSISDNNKTGNHA